MNQNEKCGASQSGSLVKRIAFRVALAAIVATGVYMFLSSGKNGSGTDAKQDEFNHVKLDYFSFVDGNEWKWSLSENTKTALKLTRVFPQGKMIKLRFEGSVSLDEKARSVEVVLSAMPKIENGVVRLDAVQLESCDMNDESVVEKPDFKDLPKVLFSLMKGDVKFIGVPLYCNATEILSMTSTEILVK